MAKSKIGRTTESEIAIGALRIAADRPDGTASTTILKKRMPNYIKLTPGDLATSKTRPNEAMFHQIVGNIISHHNVPGNIIHDGYAERTTDGIRITDAGRAHLKVSGF